LYDEEEELYACSYFDISANAISSIYAMFDLNYSKRSPGLHTLLAEILYAMEHQKQYVYLGYAYDVPSYYDYKKQFNGLECYDWEGNWVDYISPATT
jgi:arginine-tRNA-protein transferase